MYLIDINVFFEILLDQNKKEDCKAFIEKNLDRGYISDFSLYSIGIILFRLNQTETFQEFLTDLLPNISVLSLVPYSLIELIKWRNQYKLDFDDSYQYTIAKENDLKIATMDKDFHVLEDKDVLFI